MILIFNQNRKKISYVILFTVHMKISYTKILEEKG